jgi:hypothetical protein
VTEQSTGDVVPERWNAVAPKSNMWMDPAQDPRFAAGAELDGERATLLDYLRAYRLALELKCAGLDAEQLARRSVPPSTMSLLGLVRHMADVERNWFRRVMARAGVPPLYWSDDAEDADWTGAVADPAVVAGAWRAWREEVAFADRRPRRPVTPNEPGADSAALQGRVPTARSQRNNTHPYRAARAGPARGIPRRADLSPGRAHHPAGDRPSSCRSPAQSRRQPRGQQRPAADRDHPDEQHSRSPTDSSDIAGRTGSYVSVKPAP